MFNKNQGDFNIPLISSSLVFKKEEALPTSKANGSTLLQFPLPPVYSKTMLHHLPLYYLTFSVSPPPQAFLLEKAQFSCR